MDEPVLSPRIVRRGMNLSILSAVLLSLFTAVSTSAIFTGLLRSIHLTNPQIGIVMSLPLLFPPMQIIGAYLQRRSFHRKRFWLFCSVTTYTLYLALTALVTVWFRLPAAAAFALFVSLYALIQTFTQLPASINLSWLGELVPRRESASFWSRRTGFAGITTMIGGVALGKLVDLLGREESTTYIVVLLIGILFGCLSTFVFAGATDPDPAPRPGTSFLTLVSETWHNREYRLLTGFFSYQSLFAWLSTGFIFVYLQAEDGMNFSMMTIQIMLAVSALVAFLSGYFFRVVGSKYGRKPVLVLCSVLKGVEFILWGILLPLNGILDEIGIWIVDRTAALWGGGPAGLPPGVFGALPVFLLGGFVNMGIASSQSSLLTSLGNKRIQSMAIGLFFSVVGLCGVLTGSVSGYLYNFLARQSLVTDSPLNPFNVLALCSAVGYFSSILLLRKFHEDGAAPTGDMVRTLLSQNPVRAVYQANLLSQPMSEGHRVEMLNRTAGNLVAGEVLQSLWNPSSRVRDGALLTLSRNSEKAADPALLSEVIRLLDIPELGMQAMAARTLGRLGIREAVPALVARLNSEDLTLVQAVVFALGLIGSPEAVPALRTLLADPRRRELRPAAAEALSKTGDWRDAPLLLPAFEQESFRICRLQCLIALTRSLLPDTRSAHPSFEAEEKLPGSELERRLKQLCSSPLWPAGADWKPSFHRLMEACDRDAFLETAAALLAAELRLFLIVPEESRTPDEELIGERFSPGGRMRDALLNGNSYLAVSLTVQLKLWAQLKYNAQDGEPRLLLLSILIAQHSLLEETRREGGIPGRLCGRPAPGS